MYPQLNFIYDEKSSSSDQYYETPTTVGKSNEAAYLEDGIHRSAFQRNETLLQVKISSPDRKRVFTVFTRDEDKAKSILNNYVRGYSPTVRA